MKYLVTGGAGFIGSHLVDKLISQGNDVVVWDSFTTGKKENINPKAKFYDIDVGKIDPEYHTKEYDAIFHLAGEARIQPSFDNPQVVHDSNVTGTKNMLEVARHHHTPFIFAGSSSVYHDMYANPYSFSKQIAENYCTLYHKVYGVPTAIARFFNVYGPRQLEEGAYSTVIGVFERQYRMGLPLTITGDGEQRRDFTHVDDIVDALINMSQGCWRAYVFNLGTGTNHSINELASYFKNSAGTQYLPARRGEARETKADISLTQTLLGWSATRSLKEYVEQLVHCQEHE